MSETGCRLALSCQYHGLCTAGEVVSDLEDCALRGHLEEARPLGGHLEAMAGNRGRVSALSTGLKKPAELLELGHAEV
jgi:hypothetical protein